MQKSLMRGVLLPLAAGCLLAVSAEAQKVLSLNEAVALAREKNPEILMARKQVEAARGAVTEARAGFLPSVVSSGLLRKRVRQETSTLREDDYNASLRVVENVYSGGAVSALTKIARLNQEKREMELAAVTNRVVMDVRIAYSELLVNRARIGVREESVRVLQEELKSQQERFAAGTVGEL